MIAYVVHFACPPSPQPTGHPAINYIMMVHSSFVILLSMALVVIEGQIDSNIDRHGGDLADMPIRMDDDAKTEECQALCSSRRTCAAWAFKKCDKNCYLKYEDRSLNADTCVVSQTCFFIV